jgi:hypothetical protein
VLVAQPLEDPLGRVTLFLAFRLVLFQDLVDGSKPGPQLGPAHRLLPLVAGRRRPFMDGAQQPLQKELSVARLDKPAAYQGLHIQHCDGSRIVSASTNVNVCGPLARRVLGSTSRPNKTSVLPFSGSVLETSADLGATRPVASRSPHSCGSSFATQVNAAGRQTQHQRIGRLYVGRHQPLLGAVSSLLTSLTLEWARSSMPD